MGLAGLRGGTGSPASSQPVGAGQVGVQEIWQICQHDSFPGEVPGMSLSAFPLRALCQGVAPETWGRSRRQVLLSGSHCLAPTPSFATVMVYWDPASGALGHLFQVKKLDNKKNRIKM